MGLYPSTPMSRPSIADSWLSLLDKANSSVHIAAFYLTLRGGNLDFADSTDSQVAAHSSLIVYSVHLNLF